MNLRPLLVLILLPVTLALAEGTDPIQIMPLEAIQPLASPWRESTDDAPLVPADIQAMKAGGFRETYLGPWDETFVTPRIDPGVLEMEARVLTRFQADILGGKLLGTNFRPRTLAWLEEIRKNLPGDLIPLGEAFRFRQDNRAMVLDNTPIRLLPTDEPVLENHRIAGQGYPFDSLQNSAAWAGSPVYILARTRDGAWTKILGDGCAGWIRSRNLALAGARFVRRWRKAVNRQGLAAVIETAAPVLDASGRFRFQAYVGSVFPLQGSGNEPQAILIPGRNHRTQQALLERGRLPLTAAVRQPWAYTPRNAARLWRSLLGRPYGWGTMNFDNDCSAELKSFFAPFGIWLPRNSADQREAGKKVDLTALDPAQRIEKTIQLGKPYRTLIGVNGHVMLYLGPLASQGAGPGPGLMTYQNMWALRAKLPGPGTQGPADFRRIVGQSILFPVLAKYPETPEAGSQADRGVFILTHLDEEPGYEEQRKALESFEAGHARVLGLAGNIVE